MNRRTLLQGTVASGVSLLQQSRVGAAQQKAAGAAGDLQYLDLIEVGRLIQQKKLSSVDVTKAQFARIDALDGGLRSYVRTMRDAALADATKADQEIASGAVRGPLHGVPIALKDLCWTSGVPTAAGMKIHKDFVPTEDATVVARLRGAGAIILGKLALTESAFIDHHPSIQPPVNPWNAEYWTGISSSGSGVATAAGLCYGSIGTDTGGSIRWPSMANGVTGLKPTWGRVSRYGVFELAATLDHVGVITRSAADAGAMLGVIAGADPKDPTASLAPVPDYLEGVSKGLAGLRIGVDMRYATDRVDAPTKTAFEAAIATIKTMGGNVRDVAFPDPADATKGWFTLCAIEAAVAHEKTYPSRKDEYGPTLAGLLDTGRSLSGMDYQKVVLARLAFTGKVRALFEDIDLLVVPAAGVAAPTKAKMAETATDAEFRGALVRYTFPFDMSGNPTISLPGGYTAGGLPVGFQLVAGHFNEAVLVRAGAAFQAGTDYHRKHPIA
jgi:amidase